MLMLMSGAWKRSWLRGGLQDQWVVPPNRVECRSIQVNEYLWGKVHTIWGISLHKKLGEGDLWPDWADKWRQAHISLLWRLNREAMVVLQEVLRSKQKKMWFMSTIQPLRHLLKVIRTTDWLARQKHSPGAWGVAWVPATVQSYEPAER